MVQNSPRSPGRPRAYDPDTALDRAAELFWSNGFSTTSLDELSAAMGMRRPSIYNAFGDKEDLFVKALTRYRDTVGATPLRAMEAASSIDAGVDAFFAQIVEYMTADSAHRGCLLGSVAAVTDSPRVREFLQSNLQDQEAQIAGQLAQAVERGELPAGYSASEGARLAIDMMLALGSRARIGAPREDLAADAAIAAATVLAHPAP
jgi:AcrR family transcriptional regulator